MSLGKKKKVLAYYPYMVSLEVFFPYSELKETRNATYLGSYLVFEQEKMCFKNVMPLIFMCSNTGGRFWYMFEFKHAISGLTFVLELCCADSHYCLCGVPV